MPNADRRQQLIAFFSADMANSTEFKNRHQGQYVNGTFIPPKWPRYFSEVFSMVLRRFDEQMRDMRNPNEATVLTRPRLWKINGDELLFRELILPGDQGTKWLAQAVSAFINTIENVDEEMLPDGCGLRGCVWSAGFPIRNKQIRVAAQHSVPIIRLDSEEGANPDFDTGLYYRDDEGLVDYLGPDMDLGFRLAAVTPPGRITCSLDIAYLLMQRHDSPSLHHVGWRVLKGIAGGAPYPIFWSTLGAQRQSRHLWQIADPTPELKTFLDTPSLHRDEFMRLAQEYWSQLRDYFHRPYTSPDDLTPEHQRIWELAVESDATEYEPISLPE